jgi:uncharacterized membrane protein
MAVTAPTVPSRPVVRSITTDDIYAALSAGWADFRAAPEFGLFFGGVYALAGILMLLQLWVWEQPMWILPLALAFPLVAPFAAIGLYEVSRRRAAGAPLVWPEVLDVVWRERHRQMPTMAFIVLAGFMIWLWCAHIMVALFLGRMQLAVYSDLGALLSTGSGLALLFFGTLVGGAIAFVLYAITAVSLPMLLDRDIDYVTAMVASWTAVTSNPVPMLTWAWIIAAGLVVAMVPFFLGLVVVLPVLGHATWHVYRKVIAPEGA